MCGRPCSRHVTRVLSVLPTWISLARSTTQPDYIFYLIASDWRLCWPLWWDIVRICDESCWLDECPIGEDFICLSSNLRLVFELIWNRQTNYCRICLPQGYKYEHWNWELLCLKNSLFRKLLQIKLVLVLQHISYLIDSIFNENSIL